MKRIGLLVFVLLLILPVSAVADENELIEKQMENLNIDEVLESYRLNMQDSEIEFDMEEQLDQMIKGEISLNPLKTLQFCLSYFLKEVRASLWILFTVLLISIIGGILSNMSSSYQTGNMPDIAYYAVYAVICILISKVFLTAVSESTQVIRQICDFVNAMVPVIVPMLALSGSITAANVVTPLLYSAISVIISIIELFIIPALFFVFGIVAVKNISRDFDFSAIITISKNVIKWVLTFMLIVYSGICAVSTFVSNTFDGIAIKGSKFAVGNFVPVVGGVLSDTVDMFLNCTNIIKTSAGTVFLIGLLCIFGVIALKLAAQILIFKVSSFLCQCVNDKKTALFISETGDVISMMFSVLVCVFVLFVSLLSIIVYLVRPIGG